MSWLRRCSGTRTWTSEGGAVCAGVLTSHVLFIQAAGFYDDVLGINLSRWLASQFRKSSWHLFFDAERVDSVHPDARVLATDVLKEHRTLVLSAHVLVKSALTRMALSVANLVMGGFLRGYRTRVEFEKELERLLEPEK